MKIGMKKVIVIPVVTAVIVGTAFLVSSALYASDDSVEIEQSSLFQKASDVIDGKYEVKTTPFKKISVFQSMANSICAINRQ
jgi:hypothetical protein